MNSSKAFAPGNLSCIFKVYPNSDPSQMGSMGLGFTINEGVIVEVNKTHPSTGSGQGENIFFNNEPINFPTVASIITTLTTEAIEVKITSQLPLGSGFGLSGASGLATTYALNELLGLNKPNKELAIVAHMAEVVNKTGLGDVTNQYFGGMLVKNKPNSEFIVKSLPLVNCPVYCKYISKLSTPSILTNPKLIDTINQAGQEALKKINQLNSLSLGEIFTISKEFALQSGLLQDKEVKQLIEKIEEQNGHASMIMLGNAVMSDIPFEGATKYIISDVSAHLL